MDLNFWKREPQVETRLISAADHFQVSNIYNRLTKFILLAGIAAFLFLFLPWTTSPLEVNKQLLLIVFSGLSLVLWLVDVVSSGYLRWRTNEFLKPVSLVLFAAALASVFSITPMKSLFGLPNSLSDSLVVVFGLSVVFFLVVNIFEDRGGKIQALMALSLCGVFVFGVLQILGIHLVNLAVAKSRSFTTIGSLNTIGVLSAVSLPFLHKIQLSGFNRYIPKVGLVFAVLTLVIINWWVMWAIAIVGMFALVSFESLNSRAFKISKSIIPLIIIVLGVFLMVVNFNLPFKNNLATEISPSYGLSWQIASAVLKEKLILGYGIENFSIAFDQYGSTALSNTTFSSAKFYDSASEFFNTLIHGGVVLGTAFLFLIAFIFWQVFKFYRHNPYVDDSSAGIMSMMAALVVAFFMFPFNISLMFVFYLTMAMIALALWGDKEAYFSIEDSPLLSLISSIGFIGGLVLVLIISYFGSLYYLADVKYAKAIEGKDLDQTAAMLTEAIEWNQKDSRYYRSLSQVAFTFLSEEIKKPNSDPDKSKNIQNYLTSSVNFAKKATDIAPAEPLNWSNLGNIYKNLLTIVDNVDRLAEEAYVKAAELRPGDPSYYTQIGMMYLSKGDLLIQLARANPKSAVSINTQAGEAYLKAEEALKKSISISNNMGLAIYNLGIVYDRLGKTKDAIIQLERLAPSNTNQAGLMFELGLLYYRDSRKSDAFNQLQRAIVLAPDYANARWYLALIYEERNDINSAIEQLEKILSVEVNKDNPVVTSKLNDLKSGKKAQGNLLDQKPL